MFNPLAFFAASLRSRDQNRSVVSERPSGFFFAYASLAMAQHPGRKWVLLGVATIAWGSHGLAATTLHFDPTYVDAGLQLAADGREFPLTHSPTIEAGATPVATPVAPSTRFGEARSMRWQLLGGYTNDFDGAGQEQFGASVSWFFIDDLSIDLQLDSNYISQTGSNVWGLEGALLFRWHFISMETWSLYADAGCGVLGTTEPTPVGGTDFNFTPQAGGGLSFDLTEEVRLMVGVRWYHISNANTGETNPGRNSVLGYAMISFPF